MTLYFFLSVFFGWLIILTYFLVESRKHYFKITERTGKFRIDEILEKLIADDDKNSEEIKKLDKEIEKIKEESNYYFSKVGLIRFDPFGKTEGEKSFVLALLDEGNNGLVMNFIYTHQGIRVYPKKIKEGKSEEYPLSEEEKKAMEQAN